MVTLIQRRIGFREVLYFLTEKIKCIDMNRKNFHRYGQETFVSPPALYRETVSMWLQNRPAKDKDSHFHRIRHCLKVC